MRHLYGIALAVVMTAVMFFAGAWGYLQLLRLPVPPGQASALPAGGGSLLSNGTALLALAALVVTALLVGLLAVIPWFSPLASGLPGLLLVAWTALYLVSVRRAVEFIPLRSHSFGAGWESLLFNGILGAVGVVMVFPMFLPSRWRGRRRSGPDELTSDVDDYLTAVTARDEAPRLDEQPPLVGTVVGGTMHVGGTPPAGVRPVDTSRITGASRALRNTGSFRMATGAQQRATGAFRSAQDTSLLRRPYYRSSDK
ncbi:MAG: hypothetical protein ACRDNS_28180 [Trebonia sp.]